MGETSSCIANGSLSKEYEESEDQHGVPMRSTGNKRRAQRKAVDPGRLEPPPLILVNSLGTTVLLVLFS